MALDYKQMKTSEVRKECLKQALQRYKQKSPLELRTFLGIYQKMRKDAIRDKDSRWRIPQAEDKLCAKDHIKLIEQALESKAPVVIGCKPAVMGVKEAKQ